MTTPPHTTKEKPKYKFVNHRNVTSSEYSAVHYWMKSNYGKASKCESGTCTKKSKTFQWALLRGKTYCRKRENFMELCGSCHLKYDKRTINFYQFKMTKCIRCGKKFRRKASNNVLCGNRKRKIGCAYKNFNEYHLKKYHSRKQLLSNL